MNPSDEEKMKAEWDQLFYETINYFKNPQHRPMFERFKGDDLLETMLMAAYLFTNFKKEMKK